MGSPHSTLYGIPVSEIARICRVSLKTAQRWKAGTICPGYCEAAILERDLGCFSDGWRNWIVRGDELISPEGWCIHVNDVLASPLLRQQLAVYQAENRALKAERDAVPELEEQPSPEKWEVLYA